MQYFLRAEEAQRQWCACLGTHIQFLLRKCLFPSSFITSAELARNVFIIMVNLCLFLFFFFHEKDHLIQITCWGLIDFWHSWLVLYLKWWLKRAGLLIALWFPKLLQGDGLIWITDHFCTKTGTPSSALTWLSMTRSLGLIWLGIRHAALFFS